MEAQFPSDEDLQALRRRIPKNRAPDDALDEAELWRWHAYNYGFRRAILDIFDKRYQYDQDGGWFNDGMARLAEKFYRSKFAVRERYYAPFPASLETVRSNWRQLRRNDLTTAELKLALPEITRMADELRRNVAKFEERSRAARVGVRLEQPYEPRPAREIPPPPPLLDINDPRVQETLRKMGES